MNFPLYELFGCRILFFLDGLPFQMYVYLSFRIFLLGCQKSGIVCDLVELSGQYESLAAVVRHFLVKKNIGSIFLED